MPLLTIIVFRGLTRSRYLDDNYICVYKLYSIKWKKLSKVNFLDKFVEIPSFS